MAKFDSVNANVGLKATDTVVDANNTFPAIPQRRLYNFGDRVAELAPEESPFFVYLSKVAKNPTNDSTFKVLENRSKIDWTDRTGTIATVTTTLEQDKALSDIRFNGTSSNDSSGVTIIPGMVIMIDRKKATTNVPIPVMARVTSQGATGAGYWNLEILDNSGDDGTDIAADAAFQVVGTSFAEGGNAPDFWSTGLDDTYGHTQIFKTSCYMTNTALATVYRGYASEWQRLWNLKLREHKVDIERALLFGQKARVSGNIQSTDGIAGFILKNAGTSTSVNPDNITDDSSAVVDLAYEVNKPYVRQIAYTSMTYDRWLGDLEVMFDPARGGSYGKFCLAGLPTITFFNKVGGTGFLNKSLTEGSGAAQLNVNLEPRQGAFGHKVLTVDTIHGQLNLVKEPLLRGISQNWMVCVDLDNVAYRPLVGNGVNRDTHILTNVQDPDEDSRKDMILTEAGLEVTLPETHALYSFS